MNNITREIFEKAINTAQVVNPGIYKVDTDKALEQLSSAVIKNIFDDYTATITLNKLNKLADIKLKRMNLEREEGESEYTVVDLADDIDLLASKLMQEAVNKFGEICSFVKDAGVIDIDAVAAYACYNMLGARGWLDSEIMWCEGCLEEAIASSDWSCLAQGNA